MLRFDEGIDPGQDIVIMTTKGEAVALGKMHLISHVAPKLYGIYLNFYYDIQTSKSFCLCK